VNGKGQQANGDALQSRVRDLVARERPSPDFRSRSLQDVQCLEHEVEIESWRAGLSEVQRLRWNHPNSIWMHWRRSIAEPALPKRQGVRGASGGGNGGRPIFFSQDMIRRAGLAIKENFSGDIFALARRALEAAFRSSDDIEELLADRRVC